MKKWLLYLENKQKPVKLPNRKQETVKIELVIKD
jgi:hypothetical protein